MNSRAVPLTVVAFVLLLLTFLFSVPVAGHPAPAANAAGEIAAGDSAVTPSLMFIENVGQFPEGARFKVHGADRAFWLADDAIWITVMEPAQPADIHDRFEPDVGMHPAEQPETARRGVNLRITFPGSNPDAELSAYQPVETTISYFLGNDPEKWRPDVPVWARVWYRDLYPGLDLAWDSAGEQPGLRLICRAADCAAALADVQLRVQGADALTLAGDGLQVATIAGDFRLPLLAVTDAAGKPLPLAGLTPRLQGESLAAPFAFPTAALFIPAVPANDPDDLLYSTYLGGSSVEAGYSLALDATGNPVLTGDTWSTDFPTTPGAFDGTFDGGYNDVFVTRLDAAGSARLYITYLGGSGNEYGRSLALDPAGNATITGRTESADFPATAGAFDTSYNGDLDVFVTRLNAGGSALLYSSFLGGSGDELSFCLALDAAGNATLTGDTSSNDFPITAGAFDASYNGYGDVFVARLNTAGSALLYSTFLGRSGNESGYSLALDAGGNATITGDTSSSGFPTTAGAFDTSYNGYVDAFVARVNATGSDLLYSTFLGGSNGDGGLGLSLDAAGNATITGHTTSNDFPITAGAFDTGHSGFEDVFVTRLNAAGSALLYSTYLGGSLDDHGYGLAVDSAGNSNITGNTTSSDFPVTAGAFDTGYNGGSDDVFVTRLNTTGSGPLYSTFLGGSTAEAGLDLALDSAGNATLTGYTESADFPITPGAFDTSYNGSFSDVFVARLELGELGYTFEFRQFLPYVSK
jgi:hypothetical protein